MNFASGRQKSSIENCLVKFRHSAFRQRTNFIYTENIQLESRASRASARHGPSGQILIRIGKGRNEDGQVCACGVYPRERHPSTELRRRIGGNEKM